MRIIDIRDARMHLFCLVDQAVKGRPFVIAEAGAPLMKVVPLSAPAGPMKRIGLLAGPIKAPDDFDDMGRREIGRMFGVDG